MLANMPDLSNLSCIGELENLRSLSVSRCPVVEIPAITRLNKLEKVTLSQLPLSDFTPIGDASQLEGMRIRYCKELDNLEFMRRCIDLRTFILEGSHVTNLGPVSDLPVLSELALIRCPELDDLSALAALLNLENLTLVSCRKLKDLSPLAHLRNLKQFTLLDCPNVKSLTPLVNNVDLKRIQLGNFDLKRMQIPEALLPQIETSDVVWAHASMSDFGQSYYYTRHRNGEPILIYRHGDIGEVFSVLREEWGMPAEQVFAN